MNKLESLGLKSGSDEHHGQRIEEVLPTEQFFSQANTWLEEASSAIFEEVVPNLDGLKGRWNPGGFMVFPLGMHELGQVRFHVYPKGLRNTSQGPNIHDHAWHLASKVLLGNYSDTIYELHDIPLEEEASSSLRLFNTRRSPGGRDMLVSSGRSVQPLAIEDRHFNAGQIHNINAGVFHLTTVSDEVLAATLVLDSPAFLDTTGVLIADSREQIGRQRLTISEDQVLIAKQQLLTV